MTCKTKTEWGRGEGGHTVCVLAHQRSHHLFQARAILAKNCEEAKGNLSSFRAPTDGRRCRVERLECDVLTKEAAVVDGFEQFQAFFLETDKILFVLIKKKKPSNIPRGSLVQGGKVLKQSTSKTQVSLEYGVFRLGQGDLRYRQFFFKKKKKKKKKKKRSGRTSI